MPAIAFATAQVYLCDTMSAVGADWILAPHVRCTSLVRGTFPTLSQATLEWSFGYMNRKSNDGSDAATAYVPKAAIQGKYCRIVIAEHGVTWHGYILTDAMDRGPEETVAGPLQRLVWGDQTFLAVDPIWHLQRVTVHSSWIKAASGPDVKVERGIGFNAGFGKRRSATYEQRENMDAGGTSFARTTTGAQLWTATKALRYLLSHYSPKDNAGAYKPIEFKLDATADAYLDFFKPTVEVEGRSIWQLINTIISPNRGLVAWTGIDLGPFLTDFNFVIRVTSLATAPILLPGGSTLPAAATILSLPSLDVTENESVMISRDLGRRFDQVICRGARRRAVFTVSTKSLNLVPSWDAADETYYIVAAGGSDAKANDRMRTSHRFERVYQVFHIPDTWDGRSNDGSGPATTSYSCPKLIASTGSIVGSEPIAMPGLRLLRTLPTKVGWEYNNATAPAGHDPPGVLPEYQRPFGVIDLGAGKFRNIHELNTGGERKTSYHLKVLDAAAGIQISPGGGMPHACAKNHFDTSSPTPSEHRVEVDYADMRFTVCGEWDAFCEGVYPPGPFASEPIQYLYVSIGNRARFDWLAEGTIWDCQNEAIKTVATAGALRDNRQLCEQVARLAFEWYGQTRASVQIVTTGTDPLAALGDLIDVVGSGAAAETVNAVVSQITHDFVKGRLTVKAGFHELDFSKIV